MENIKEYLKKEISEEIKKAQEDIEKSNKEIEILEAKIKIEEKLANFKDLNEDILNDVRYGVFALRDFLFIEKSKNKDLENEFELLRRRKQIINQFEEQDL